MDEKENNFDYAALVSLIFCVRNEANLNAQLSWKALGRQLSFTGFLIVGLGLLYKPFGDIAVILIAAAGVISTVMLFFSARMNNRHAREYNNSCEHLESCLPDDIRPHAVMNTFNNRNTMRRHKHPSLACCFGGGLSPWKISRKILTEFLTGLMRTIIEADRT